MSNINGKITAPVTTKDIQTVLGASEKRQSKLCTHPNINKWSKVKPITYPTNGERCPNFKGTLTQNSSGVFYGLHAGSGYVLSADIHLAKWDYFRPTGGMGISPFRRLDFAGYNHSAKPTIYGELITQEVGKVVYDRTTPFEFRLHWNFANNTDGVDVFTCFPDNSGVADMSNWYLCVMIGNMATVMVDVNGNRLPIMQFESGYTEYKCPKLPSSLQAYMEARQVTFFLADISSTNDDSIRNMLSGWVGFDSIRADIPILTVPEAVDYRLEWVQTAIDYGVMLLSVSYNQLKDAIVVHVDFYTRPSEDRHYALQFQLYGVSDKIQISLYGGTVKNDLEIFITKSDLGIRWDDGDEYQYLTELYGYEGSTITAVPLASMGGYLTID